MSAKNTSARKYKHEHNKETTYNDFKAHVPAISKNSLCDVTGKWCSEHLPWDSGFSWWDGNLLRSQPLYSLFGRLIGIEVQWFWNRREAVIYKWFFVLKYLLVKSDKGLNLIFKFVNIFVSKFNQRKVRN